MSQAQAPTGPTSTLAPPTEPAAPRASLVRALIVLAAPVLAEHALHIVVGLTDTYLANHLESHKAEATAAVGTVGYLFWFIGLFAGAIGTGSTAIIAREVGARHRRRANSVCGQSMLFAAFLGLALAVVLWLAAGPVITFTNLRGEARALALSYLHLVTPSVPFLVVMFVANACLRGAGDTLTPAISMIVVDVLNVAFSCGLTYGLWGLPRMGFDGIAIGTMVAYVGGGVLQIAVLLVGRGGIKLHLHRLRPHLRDMKRIVRIGVPAGVTDAINWVANFGLLKVVNRTHPLNVAAASHINAVRIESISYMTGFAIAVAVTTMVGQSLGMKDPRRAQRAAYLGYAIGGGFMTLVGVLFIFFAQYPAALLAGDPAIRDLTAKCLQITGFCQAGFAAAIIFGGALRGAGDTFAVMLITMVSILTLRLGGVWLLGYYRQPLAVIWILLACDLFIRGLLVYGRFLHGGWKRIRV
ncbi:MAG TPA: MATE family efflux transporter [Tepidisphaeraceae bacterium]|nr:MATE family efflux transporter [Tepidisphaeraceae bacterium]